MAIPHAEDAHGAERRGVRAVERALDILTAFSAAHPQLQLRDLADVAGLPKPSTHRIAVSLVQRGFLRQEPDGVYSLGSRLLELGGLVSNTAALTQLTRSAVDELSRLTGETVLVAEADWMDRTILITNKRDATHPLAVLSPIGQRSVIGNGCIGKAIIAGLESDDADDLVGRLPLSQRTPRSITDPKKLLAEATKSRRRGYAIESGEHIVGVAGVAAPVMVGDRPIGAVAVVAPVSRSPRRRLDELGRMIVHALAVTKAADQDNDVPHAAAEE